MLKLSLTIILIWHEWSSLTILTRKGDLTAFSTNRVSTSQNQSISYSNVVSALKSLQIPNPNFLSFSFSFNCWNQLKDKCPNPPPPPPLHLSPTSPVLMISWICKIDFVFSIHFSLFRIQAQFVYILDARSMRVKGSSVVPVWCNSTNDKNSLQTELRRFDILGRNNISMWFFWSHELNGTGTMLVVTKPMENQTSKKKRNQKR